MNVTFSRSVAALVGAVAVLCLVVACHSYTRPPPAPSGPTTPPPSYQPPPPTGGPSPDVAAQIDRGAALFGQTCARCHGPAAQGTERAPALVGPGSLPAQPPATRKLRRVTFHTAKDVGMFIKDNMPPGASTPPDQTGAILAWLVQSHGITPTETMNPTTAAKIILNP